MSRLRSRVAAAALDQVAFSLQNFAITFSALHALDLADLGAFTLAMTLTLLTQVAVRALGPEVLTIRFGDQAASLRTAAGQAAGLALISATTIAAVCLIAAALLAERLDADLATLIVCAGVSLVPIVVQDTWRYALFAARRMWAATLNDILVCLTTLALLAVLFAVERVTPATLVLAWAAGAVVGGAVGGFQTRALPRPDRARAWWREHRDLGVPLAGSVLAQQSMGRLSLVIISALAGVAQLGLVTAARTVLTPINTLIAATYSFAVPEAVQRRRRSHRDMVRFTSALSLGLAGVAVVLTSALLVIPREWGVILAGQNWDSARSLLVPTSLWIVGIALSQGARVGLRALERTDAIFRLTLVLGALLLVSTTVGTIAGQGRGAAWAFGIASVLGQPAWWWVYRQARRADDGPASVSAATGRTGRLTPEAG